MARPTSFPAYLGAVVQDNWHSLTSVPDTTWGQVGLFVLSVALLITWVTVMLVLSTSTERVRPWKWLLPSLLLLSGALLSWLGVDYLQLIATP